MTMVAIDRRGVGAARTRGELYALAAALWRYPDSAAVPLLVETARRLAGDPETALSTDDRTRGALATLAEHLAANQGADGRPAMCGQYAALFGHAVRGHCPLYELEYGHGEIVQQASELADIAGFYRAFGLETADETTERVDHIAVEFEFMAVLCAKEAHGLHTDEQGLVDAALDGQRAFLRDHLARWVPGFCARVEKSAPDGVYAAAARLAGALIDAECGAFGVPLGPAYLTLRPVDPQMDAEIHCGTAGAGEQVVPLTLEGASPVGG